MSSVKACAQTTRLGHRASFWHLVYNQTSHFRTIFVTIVNASTYPEMWGFPEIGVPFFGSPETRNLYIDIDTLHICVVRGPVSGFPYFWKPSSSGLMNTDLNAKPKILTRVDGTSKWPVARTQPACTMGGYPDPTYCLECSIWGLGLRGYNKGLATEIQCTTLLQGRSKYIPHVILSIVVVC